MNPATGIRAHCGSARIFTMAAAVLLASASANAAVTISSGATSNMSCANGLCVPTAKDAVLNVGDLGNLLASGNVEVTTTGSGVQAKDIVVTAALSWSTSNALALDAHRSIAVGQPVSVAGQSALALTTNDGGKNGDLSFGKKGNVTFANLSSSLTIDGVAYTLVNSIQSLASAIANNPSGDFALASSYNAQQDGTYTTNPVATKFSGTFEGLGNAISHFTMKAIGAWGGFFTVLESGSVIRDFGLPHARVSSQAGAGGLARGSYGSIIHCYVTGSVSAHHGKVLVGGLLMGNDGTISDSYSTASITGGKSSIVGGLVAENDSGAEITNSFTTGAVTAKKNGTNNLPEDAGGLVGVNGGSISNSYATGAVVGGTTNYGNESTGGLVGFNDGPISVSYSAGPVSKEDGPASFSGGLIGADDAPPGSLVSTYWDTETSGQNQGAGYPYNDPGITGLTTQQFQSGLPDGFDPTIWGEKPKINNGFPYLLNNPPA